MDSLDDLVAMPGLGADAARELLDRPALPMETPEDTTKRLRAEDLVQERTVKQTNRLTAKDFAARNIPTYTEPETGAVSPITDEAGKPLTQYDKRNDLAYDSKGQPREITSGASGEPVLADPFANVPIETDVKTGDKYRKRSGLPWQWAGRDENIVAQNLQREKDKAVDQAATALGRKLTLDERDYHHTNVDIKDTASRLTDLVPLLNGKGNVSREEAQKYIDQQFDAKNNPLANKKAGIFDRTLHADAIAERERLDSAKTTATALADQHYDLRSSLADKKAVIDAQTNEELRLRTIQADRARRRLDELGIGPSSSPSEVATAHRQVQSEIESGTLPQESESDVLPEDLPDAAGVASLGEQAAAGSSPAPALSDKAQSAIVEARAGKRAYNVDDKNAIVYNPDKIADGIQQAAADELIDPARAKEILPLAQKAQEAAQKRAQLLHEAGKNPKLKALATGAVKGSAFAAGFPLGAGVGAAAGAAIPGLDATGIPEALGAIIGGMISGTVASFAVKKMIDKLGQYNDTIHSFAAASELHPYYDAAGNLVSFGVGIPKAATSAIASGIESASSAKVAQAIARSYTGSGGGLWNTIENLSKDASIRSAQGVSKSQIAKAITARVGAAAATNVAIDTVVNEGSKALGFQDQGETWQSAAFAGVIGAFMSGHGITFEGRSTGQVADVLQRGKARMDVGVGLGEKLDPQYIASIAKNQDEVARYEKPLTPVEQEVWEAFGREANKLANTGKAPIDPAKIAATARTALVGGQPYGVTAVEIGEAKVAPETSATPGGTPTTAGLPGGPQPQVTPAAEAGKPIVPEHLRAETEALGIRYDGPMVGKDKTLHTFTDLVGPKPTTLAVPENATPEDLREKVAQTRAKMAGQQAPTPVDVSAHQAAMSPLNETPTPTQAQKEAGNYQKGHHIISGLDISIENPAGTQRQPEYEPLVSHYGYVKGTVGADKDHVDIFVKQGTPDDWKGPVFVVNQHDTHDLGTGDFDEHKAVLGVTSKAEAMKEYLGNYEHGWTGGKSVAEFNSVESFKKWLKSGDKGKPAVGEHAGGPTYPQQEVDVAKNDPEVYALVRALRSTAGHEQRITNLYGAKNDQELLTKVSEAFGSQGGMSSPIGMIGYHGGKNPRLEIGHGDEKKVIKGKELAALVRRALKASGGKTTPKDALAAARKYASEKAGVIKALGATVKFTGVKAGSGIVYDPNTRTIKIDPTKFATNIDSARQRQLTEGLEHQDWIQSAIDHEIIHASQDAVAREQGKTVEEYYSEGEAFPDDLMHASREFYGPEWDDHPPWLQRAEAVRMVIEGRWKGKITEEIYKYIADWVNYFRNIDVTGNPSLEKMVADNEKKLRDAGIDIGGATTKEGQHAVTRRKQPTSSEPEHRGTPRGENVQENAPKVRSKKSAPTVGGDRPEQSEGERPAKLPSGASPSKLDVSLQKDLKAAFDDLELPAAAPAAPQVSAKQRTIVAQLRGGKTVEEVAREHSMTAAQVEQAYDTAVKEMPSASPDEQVGFPAAKLGTFVTLAQRMAEQGVASPEDLARELNLVAPVNGAKYSQAFWDLLGSLNPELRGTHNWKEVFANVTPSELEVHQGMISMLQEQRADRLAQKGAKPDSLVVQALDSQITEHQKTVALLSGEETPAPDEPIEPAPATTKAAERAAKLPDDSTKKMRVQKEYLIEALDKAIDDAPAELDKSKFEAGIDMMDLDAMEKVAQKERKSGDYSAESGRTVDAKFLELAEPLFAKYNTPTGIPGYAGSGIRAMGGAEVHPAFGPKDFEGRQRIEVLQKQMRHSLDRQSAITIEIPGDGTFSIVNSKEQLKAFRDQAKKFPTTQAKSDIKLGRPRQTETPITPLGKKSQVAGALIKAAAIARSKDETRFVLNYVKSTGKEIVATDGRRLVIVNGRAGGSEKSPVYFTAEGKTYKPPKTYKDDKGEDQPFSFTYPNFRQVIPDPDTQKKYGTIDTAELFRLIQQATQVTTDKSNSIKLWQDKNGNFGVTSNTPDLGSYSGGDLDPKTAKLLAAYSPEFLMDGLRIARMLGNEKIDIFMDKKEPEMTPVTFRGDKFMYVLMPMRVSDSYAWSSPTEKAKAANVPHPLSPEADKPDVPPEPEPEQIEAANAEAQVEAPEAAAITDENAPSNVVLSDSEAKKQQAPKPSVLPPPSEEKVTDVWEREYRDALAKKERLTNTGILSDIGHKGRLIGKTPEDVYTDFLDAGIQPHNAAYVVRNVFSDQDWNPPTNTKQIPLIEVGKTKAPELRRLRQIAERLVRKELELKPDEPLTDKEFSKMIGDYLHYGAGAGDKDKTLVAIAKKLIAAERKYAPNAGQLTAEERDELRKHPTTIARKKALESKSTEFEEKEEVIPTPPADVKTNIANAVASYTTNERDKLIDRIVAAERPQMPDVVETFELLGDDGKWRRAGGFPGNVKATGERRSAGFVVRDRVQGTTHGKVTSTREEQEKIQSDRIEKNSANFRAELEKMTDQRLKGQADYWLKNEKGYLPPVSNFENFKTFVTKLMEGEITADQVKKAWAEWKENRPKIKQELARREKKELLRMSGMGARLADSKDRLLSSALDGLESYFQTGDGLSIEMSGTDYTASKRRAMDADVEKWTDELIQAKAQERRDAIAAKEKALTNPETRDEFDQFVMKHGQKGPFTPEEKAAVKGLKGQRLLNWVKARGESKLTPEQLAKYDSLRGVESRADLQREKERKAVVGQVYGAKDVPMQVEKHFHSKRGHEVYIVTMGDRVDASTFKEMAIKARRLGGNYTRAWKPTNSPAGFTFNDEKSANDFVSLQQGAVDRSDQVQANEIEKMANAAERFRAMADSMDERADEVLNADRQTNTARRVAMAEGIEGRANSDKAMAETLRNLADAIESGEATHLGGIRNRKQVEMFNDLARSAQREAWNAEKLSYADTEKRKGEPIKPEQMDHATYPFPYIDKSDLLRLIEKGRNTSGAKLLAGRVAKFSMLSNAAPDAQAKEGGYLRNATAIELVQDLMKAVGNDTLQWKFEKYNRLQQMGIRELPALRAALREFVQYRGRKAEADPIKQAERALVGVNIPGFFPTPKSVVDRIIAAADIKPGMSVLEPSAGKGDIADAAREAGAEVTTAEIVPSLRNILKQKGHTVLENGDFLEHPTDVKYDRILMNPPFENFQDIDHVRHAYDLLKPGGKLIAVMSRSPFFRSEKKPTAFREWLDSIGGYAEELPEGTFTGKDAFRSTGVNTSIVEITKPLTAELPAANPFVTFWQKDVDDTLKTAGKTASQAFREMVNFFSPTTNSDQVSRDLLGEMRGERQYNMELLSRMGKAFTKAFNKMSRPELVKFVDNVKQGRPQSDAMQQSIADTIRTIDIDTWKEANKVGIPLEFLENHYRVMWKIIPGSEEAMSNVVADFNRMPKPARVEFEKRFNAGVAQADAESRRIDDVMRNLKIDPNWTPGSAAHTGASGQTRRPLQGDRGMMKQHTLPNMSVGQRLGGVPHTYNPWTNFERSQASLWQFISARRMFDAAKDLGKIEFVRVGANKPDGFSWIDDNIGNVFFRSEQGLVHPGKWAAEDGLARLINNHLSPDLLRSSTIGRGLLYTKNATTALELAFSPFHFIFVSNDAAAASLGLGLQKVFNRGFLHGDVAALFEGLRDMVTSPGGMVIDYKIGSDASKLFSEKGFAMTPAGTKLLKKFPDAARMVREMFDAGMKLTSEQDWDIDAKRAFLDSLNQGNYIGSTLRAFPAINEALMDPLFKVYIPNIKFGAFMRDYANALKEREADLAAGKITRSQIAREVVRFEEDRFGEMNFDNLYWNRTFKSAMQLFTRSVTWRLGSLSAFAKVFSGQGGEMLSAIREHRAPRLHRNFAWLFGLCVVTATMASVIQKLLTGRNPESLTDLTFPQIDPENKDVRVSLPTYIKDPVHIAHSPGGFVTSALSGWLSRVSEIWNNHDFYGVEIRHEDDPLYKQIFDVLGREGMSMLPFSIQGYKRMKDQDVSRLRRLFALAGLNPAPHYIGQTRAEQLAIDIAMKRMPPGTKTREQFEKQVTKSKLRSEVRRGNVSEVNEVLSSGALSPKEIKMQMREAKMTPLQARVNRLTIDDIQRVERVATPEEKVQLQPIIARKLQANKRSSARAPMFTGF